MIILLIILGLAFGSFLNVLIYRLNTPDTPPFWKGRSFCPKCHHSLSWRDDIPLFSFLLLHGYCRYCQKKISWQYPVVELLTALITILLWFYLSPVLNVTGLLGYWVTVFIFYSFLVIFFSDLIYGLIPDLMVVSGSLLVIGSFALKNLNHLTIQQFNNVFVGLVSSAFFLLIVLFTRGQGMGLGDVTLAFLMGLFLGFPHILVALWVGFISGGAVAILLLLLRRTSLSATIPLGPFLILGTLIAYLWSAQILFFVGF